MQITRQLIRQVSDEETASLIMSFLHRSTVSAELKQCIDIQERKGKLIEAIVSLKYYDIDEVIKYCEEHSTLSQAKNCLNACADIRNNHV